MINLQFSCEQGCNWYVQTDAPTDKTCLLYNMPNIYSLSTFLKYRLFYTNCGTINLHFTKPLFNIDTCDAGILLQMSNYFILFCFNLFTCFMVILWLFYYVLITFIYYCNRWVDNRWKCNMFKSCKWNVDIIFCISWQNLQRPKQIIL